MSILVPEIVAALERTRDVFWAGSLPPRFDMTASTTIYDPDADFREPSARHQSFDLVFLVERDLAAIKQWPLVLDEALRLLRAGGLFVVRMRQGAMLSLFELANALEKWTAGRIALVWQGFAGPDFTMIVRFTATAPRASGLDSVAFGLITDGRKPEAVHAFVTSVLAMDAVPHVEREIIVCGPARSRDDLGALADAVTVIEQPDAFQAQGWITRKKNMIVQGARSRYVIVAHDRYRVQPDFLRELSAFGGDLDIVVPAQETQEGVTIPAWVMTGTPLNWARPGWMDYGDYHPNLYLNGGVTIGRTAVLRDIGWNELLFWNQAEDVELSRRLQDAGVVPRLARRLKLVTGPLRPGVIEGFERLPWRADAYVGTNRPPWLAPEAAPPPPHRPGETIVLAHADVRDLAARHGLIVAHGWDATREGLVWNKPEPPALSLRLEWSGGDLTLVLAGPSGAPALAAILVNTARVEARPMAGVPDAARFDIPAAVVPDTGILHLRLESARAEPLVLTALTLEPAATNANIDFGMPVEITSRTAARYLLGGWSGPEDWGVWSVAKRAEAALRLPPGASADLRLSMRVRGFVDAGLPDLVMGITVNDMPVGAATFGARSKEQDLEFLVPAPLVAGCRMLIGFHASRLATPRSVAESDDERPLALGLMRLGVSRWEDPEGTANDGLADVAFGVPVPLIDGRAGGCLVAGWHEPEDFGVWSADRAAKIRLRLPEASAGVRVQMSLRAFVAPALSDLVVRLIVNGIVRDSLIFDLVSHDQDVVLALDGDDILNRRVTIEIETSRQVRPMSVGHPHDQRRIAVAIRRLIVWPA